MDSRARNRIPGGRRVFRRLRAADRASRSRSARIQGAHILDRGFLDDVARLRPLRQPGAASHLLADPARLSGLASGICHGAARRRLLPRHADRGRDHGEIRRAEAFGGRADRCVVHAGDAGFAEPGRRLLGRLLAPVYSGYLAGVAVRAADHGHHGPHTQGAYGQRHQYF